MNSLEMVSENGVPEDGISFYIFDRTQGPACAMAAPVGTLYRYRVLLDLTAALVIILDIRSFPTFHVYYQSNKCYEYRNYFIPIKPDGMTTVQYGQTSRTQINALDLVSAN